MTFYQLGWARCSSHSVMSPGVSCAGGMGCHVETGHPVLVQPFQQFGLQRLNFVRLISGGCWTGRLPVWWPQNFISDFGRWWCSVGLWSWALGCDQDQRYKQQKRAFSRGWLPFPLEMVRSSVIQEVLRVELLLLEMSRVIVLGIYRLPHWLLSGQVFQGVPPGGNPVADPRQTGKTISLCCHGNDLASPWISCGRWLETSLLRFFLEEDGWKFLWVMSDLSQICLYKRFT